MCKNCGNPILVSIFKGGDWCSDDCRKALLPAESVAPLKVEFSVDLSTAVGRLEAMRLCSWLAKERYDCPDPDVSGAFNGFLQEVEDRLYGKEEKS